MSFNLQRLPNADPPPNHHRTKKTKRDAELHLGDPSRRLWTPALPVDTGIAPTVPSSRSGGSAGSVAAEAEDEADRPRPEGRQRQLLQKAGYDDAFSLLLAPDPPYFTLP